MIRLIAAIDIKGGLSRHGQLPWDLPSDKARFRKLTLDFGANVLMGRKTYESIGDFLHGRHNFIASQSEIKLEPNCTLVKDVKLFLETFDRDLWVVGGQQIYELSLEYADELYLTIIDRDFSCDRFFPDYSNFKLVSKEGPFSENGLSFSYQRFVRL